MSDTPMIQRVRELVDPIASDLDLDVYDIEQRRARSVSRSTPVPGHPAASTSSSSRSPPA